MKRYLLVHYGEIGLKKSNAPYFVKKLRKALQFRLQKRFGLAFRIRHTLQRFVVTLPDDAVEEDVVEVLRKISGVRSFKFVYEGAIDLELLGEQIWKMLPDFSKDDRPRTFRVKCKRSMQLPYTSVEADRAIAADMYSRGWDVKAKMKGAEFIVDVEFFNGFAYFSFKKYQGLGGLPPNSESKLVCLLSPGFDSPVAAFRMMRRGARVIFVHFHGYPYTDIDELQQVKDLVKVLSQYQFDTKLYLLPFGEFQKSIGTNLEVPAKVRTIIFRRMMLRIAEEVAYQNRAKGLITGDNYGQVASQTPENLFAVHNVTTIPLFQPLIAMDKEDIIQIAREIGTADISALPCKDTCTMFTSKKPELRANIYDLQRYEATCELDFWLKKVLSEGEVIDFDDSISV